MIETRKRKRYMTKSVFQLKYTAIILLFIFLTVFLAGAMTYITLFPYLSEKLANVYPQSRLITILTYANVRLLYAVAILVPLAAWFGILLSHRIAGPWLRLENILLDIAEGNIAGEVKLRKGDELVSLADAINKVIAKFKADRVTIRQNLDTLNAGLAKLQDELGKMQPDFPMVKQLASNVQASADKLKSFVG